MSLAVQSLSVTPTTGPVGADIGGIDLTAPLPQHVVAALEAAFAEYGVLRFRGRRLEAPELVQFSRHFGELQPHVQRAYRHPDAPEVVVMRNVDAEGRFDEAGARRGATEDLRDGWHSDLSYEEVAAKATLLHSHEVPSRGGNTCFSDTHKAFLAMPPALRRRLTGLRAEFRYGGHTRNAKTGIAASALDAAGQAAPAVVHPVVCAHPVTGRPAIYLNPLIAVRILDVPEAESDALMGEVFDWIDRPEFRWEHEWRVGDTLMWDNLGGIMHCGRLDYPRNERRIFIRTTVRGHAIRPYTGPV